MSRRKLQRFAELDSFPNSFYNPVHMKGAWHNTYFKNNNPITIELGCGRGEYTVGLARMYPDRNFIGMDLKGARLWKGAKTAVEEGLSNTAFIRSRIEQAESYFFESEIDEIWLTFPDPQPQLSREKKRLTHPRFVNMYKQFLKPGAIINLKTDNDQLYEYTLQVIGEQGYKLLEKSSDIYASDSLPPELQIRTTYENKYLAVNKNINYIRFSI